MTRRLSLCAVMIALVAPGLAVAQAPRPASAPPVQSLIQGQDPPVQIQAATLAVSDKNKMATFSGAVQMVQGDTTMKCQKLVVFYDQEAKPAPAGPKSAQNIRRIEARGGVTIITKDQYASGDLGVYDLIAKTITLTGNVVVSHGNGKTQ
jgi:lipopolysaccharide export system protein LptA